jgi:hypothetical protein
MYSYDVCWKIEMSIVEIDPNIYETKMLHICQIFE